MPEKSSAQEPITCEDLTDDVLFGLALNSVLSEPKLGPIRDRVRSFILKGRPDPGPPVDHALLTAIGAHLGLCHGCDKRLIAFEAEVMDGVEAAKEKLAAMM